MEEKAEEEEKQYLQDGERKGEKEERGEEVGVLRVGIQKTIAMGV